MVTHPANMIMTIVPGAIASLASFQRIQDFVSKPHFQDIRLRQEHAVGAISVNANSEVAIEFKDVELRLAGSTNPTVEKVNLRVDRGSMHWIYRRRKEHTGACNCWRNHTHQRICLDYQ
jgi:ATP-binding cassette subfamily C (CFTR/MRP) protein 1